MSKSQAPTSRPVPQDRPASVARRASASQTGKGGEHLVASRLLFLGHDVSIVEIDTGVDIIGARDGRTFYIQVKTANPSGNRYRFDIRAGSFERHAGNSVFYVFVLRHGSSPTARRCEDCLVLPHTKVQEYVAEGLIKQYKRDTVLSVTIIKDGDRFFLGKKGNEIKFYMNNLSLIR